jgi:8-oxo-dGTP diphosphatase
MEIDHHGEKGMVAVGGMVVRENEVLTVRIANGKDGGSWRLPGGIAQTKGSLEGEVVRHVAEETGIKCDPQRIAGIRYAVRECRCAEKDETYIVFTAGYLEGEPGPVGKGILEAVFMPIEELLNRKDVIPLSLEMVRGWQENGGLVRSDAKITKERRWNVYECYTLGGN